QGGGGSFGGGYAAYAAIVMRAYQGISQLATNRGYSGGEQALLALHHVGLGVADYFTGGLAELGPLLGNLIGDDNIFGKLLIGIPAFIRPHISRRVREAMSVRDFLQPHAQGILGAINRTATPEELWTLLVRYASPLAGGHSELSIVTRVNGKMVGDPDRGRLYKPYATLDELLDHPDGF